MSAATAPGLTDQQVREMAAAIQAGADGVFTNCAKAVHDTAELYAGTTTTVAGVR